jgi:geranylgeranyl diphosphate synthase, type II
MHSFEELSKEFSLLFSTRHFPEQPGSLYDPAEYFLGMGGKRVRPILCLMGNELFDTINPDAYTVATAIELFHNFTLIHDDIMDEAPLRRGLQTVHEKYGQPTALLTGDVMLVVAYDYLNKIKSNHIHKVIQLFNKTAKQVCEGQQLDMDFEKQETVNLSDYLKMIELKTSVLLAASLQLGAILGGAQEGNQRHLYEFGKNLGMAFQVQDDYLDAFGDPEKFGKQVGGDIMSNKKTFLMIYAMEAGSKTQVNELNQLIIDNSPDKINKVLEIFRQCNIDKWAVNLKEKYITDAFRHLDEIAVVSSRKKPLMDLTHFLVQREY